MMCASYSPIIGLCHAKVVGAAVQACQKALARKRLTRVWAQRRFRAYRVRLRRGSARPPPRWSCRNCRSSPLLLATASKCVFSCARYQRPADTCRRCGGRHPSGCCQDLRLRPIDSSRFVYSGVAWSQHATLAMRLDRLFCGAIGPTWLQI